jgi:hypothetical protein
MATASVKVMAADQTAAQVMVTLWIQKRTGACMRRAVRTRPKRWPTGKGCQNRSMLAMTPRGRYRMAATAIPGAGAAPFRKTGSFITSSTSISTKTISSANPQRGPGHRRRASRNSASQLLPNLYIEPQAPRPFSPVMRVRAPGIRDPAPSCHSTTRAHRAPPQSQCTARGCPYPRWARRLSQSRSRTPSHSGTRRQCLLSPTLPRTGRSRTPGNQGPMPGSTTTRR